jgi:hypothetical protein
MPVAFGHANKLTLRLLTAPKIVVKLGSTPQGPAGPPGNSEPIPPYTLLGNDVATSENPQGLTISQVKSMLGYVSAADLLSALGAYTPTSGLAAIATSGNAADLFGTLDNSRLSSQVVRNDFSYADPSWITTLSASKLIGTILDARLTSNVVLKNASNVFTSGNTFQASQVFDASIVLGGLTGPRIRNVGQVFRLNTNDDTARAGLEVGDIISTGLLGIGMAVQSARSLSVLPVNTGDRSGIRVNDYGSLASAVNQSAFEVTYLGGTPSIPSSPVSGHYRNLLVFRTGGTNGLLSSSPSFAIRSTIGAVIGSSLSVVDTSFIVTPTITGVPIAAQTIYGNTGLIDFPIGQIQLGTNTRLKNSGGNFHVRNSADSGFASLEAFNGTFNNYVTAVQGIFSGAGGVAHLNGAIGVGAAVWLEYTANTNTLFKRDAVNGRMHVTYTQGTSAAAALTQFHSRVTVDDYLTSAFQSIAADPTTSNIAAGLARLVKNTTTGEIATFINDGGVIKRSGSTSGAITFQINGGGAAIAAGEQPISFRVPFACTITGWELVADAAGSIIIDIWKDSYANFPPTNGDSIVASAKPTLTAQIKAQSSTLTGWSTALNAGDYIKLEVESAATVQLVSLTLTVTRA